MSNFLSCLNDKQRDVVENGDGYSLVVSGAGSGKTMTLTYRIANLIHSNRCYPDNILAITFTNKAAREMKGRIHSLLSNIKGHWWIGTFHGVCIRILSQYGKEIGIPPHFTILDETDQKKELKNILEKRADNTLDVDQMVSCISFAKNNLIGPDEYLINNSYNSQKVIGEIYKEYNDRLHQMNALDFDDLIFKTIILIETVPEVRNKLQEKFKYVIVDES